MAKVVQYLRGIDLTGHSFDSYSPPIDDQSGTLSRRRRAASKPLDDTCPVYPTNQVLSDMQHLQWIKLRSTGLSPSSQLPSQLIELSRLESLSLDRNSLTHLSGLNQHWPTIFPNLRSLTCRKNQLTSDEQAIPPDIFECPNLSVIDFSCNQLTSLPKGIQNASKLLVLNLSDNQISTVTSDLFMKCLDLIYLDLSGNQLESIPPQIRRCTDMQTLVLNRNPLPHALLQGVSSLKCLQVLGLSATSRRLDNIPTDLNRLTQLRELDLSCNNLPKIPEPVLELRSLHKLDLSHNQLTDLAQVTDNWPDLTYLSLAFNQLTHLPSGLTRLTGLRKLYVNNNLLTFDGIPSSIGKLSRLQVFDAGNNQLKTIPESLCRCGLLKRLNLNSNQLVTLPDAIHYLIESIDSFEYDANRNLVFPPKPAELKKGAGLAYYNIDFSLDAQLRQIGIKRQESTEPAHPSDTQSRMRRLIRHANDGSDSKLVLEGFQRVVRDKEAILRQRDQENDEEHKKIAAKRWQDQLNKPQLNYSGIFDEDTGSTEGVEMWEMDEFYPRRVVDDVLQGNLFSGDCYIVLHSKLDLKSGSLDWVIYYWIGQLASRDKQTCAAIHAVNLRNLLGAEGRTLREEQGDESDDFHTLFNHQLMVMDGARGESGFYHVEQQNVVPKLYRLFTRDKHIGLTAMPLDPLSLDPKYVYLLDAFSRLFVWLGSQTSLMLQTKGRLLAERINVRERKAEAVLQCQTQGLESNDFWAVLTGKWQPPPLPLNTTNSGGEESNPDPACSYASAPTTVPAVSGVPRDFIPLDWKAPKPILYDVLIGKGYLEMPQVALNQGRLVKTLLDPKHVYILDSGGELFVWMGDKTTDILRSAGRKLAQELSLMMPRQCFGGAEQELVADFQRVANGQEARWQPVDRPVPQLSIQGAESQIFRAQFRDWDDAMPVDFTRTMESMLRRGADIKAILEKDKPTVDLRALLNTREEAIKPDRAVELMESWNEDLVEPIGPDLEPCRSIQQLVLVNGKWVRVEPQWFGHFFSRDCFIVIGTYLDDQPLPEEGETGGADNQANPDTKGEGDELVDYDPDRTKTIVYFWQGREASDLAWLTFNFSLRKEMAVRLAQNPNPDGRPLTVEFVRLNQQQEELTFLAHFRRQIVIHTGSYRDWLNARHGLQDVDAYYLRANGNLIATRCVQIEPSAQWLNSCFSYIVKVPPRLLDDDDDSTSDCDEQREVQPLIYCWLGRNAPPDDKELIEVLAKRIYSTKTSRFEIIYEQAEPALFWTALGGKKSYDTSADYINLGRLFRLSNDQGYFRASEKCSDFSQDDLEDDDAMLLDTGDEIFLWWGSKTSDVERKLSLQAAKLYQQQLTKLQPNRPRKLKLTAKKFEPHAFRRCFHGWGPYREAKDWSG